MRAMRALTQKRVLPTRSMACLNKSAFHSSSQVNGELKRVDTLGGAIDFKQGARHNVSGLTATVFGSTGFVGRYVIGRLGRVGAQVICPYRGDGFNTRHLKLMGDLGQIVPTAMDFSDVESVNNVVNRSNVVINTLGSQVETNNYSFHDANVKTTYRLCKAAKEAGVKRFIHLSSTIADKNSPSRWARSKAEAEEIVRDFFPDATIIRATQIYGAEDKFLNRLVDIAHYSPISPLVEDGEQKVQPIYVGDVSRAIFNAIGMKESIGQTYEIGGPNIMTQKELSNFLFGTIMKPSTTVNVPHEIAHLYGYAYEFLPLRWRIMSRDTVAQQQIDHTVRKGITTKTLEDLNVKATDFYDQAPPVIMHHRQERALNRHGIEDKEPMVPSASQYWEGKEGDWRFRKFY